jgi:hypothetical protein
MAKCSALTANGQHCQAHAIAGSTMCFTHDPAQGTARAKAHQLGGQRRRVGHAGDVSRIPPEVRSVVDVMKILDYDLAETLILENSEKRGRLLVTLCSAFIEAMKAGEWEGRVAALEAALRTREVAQ